MTATKDEREAMEVTTPLRGSVADPGIGKRDGAGFVIEKGVPLPKLDRRTGAAGAPLTYPWPLMEIGDSVVVPSDETRCTGLGWAHRNRRRFVSRKQDGGFRIWRVS